MHRPSQTPNDPRHPLAPILVAYDGSENARHAIARAGELFPGRAAIVLHAWEPVELAAIRRGVIGMSATPTEQAVDATADEEAARVATEGAAPARRAGLAAEARTVQAVPSTWEAIVCVTDEAGAVVDTFSVKDGHWVIRSIDRKLSDLMWNRSGFEVGMTATLTRPAAYTLLTKLNAR